MGMYLTNPNFNPLKTMVITGQGGVSSTQVSPPATCVCQAWEVWSVAGTGAGPGACLWESLQLFLGISCHFLGRASSSRPHGIFPRTVSLRGGIQHLR